MSNATRRKTGQSAASIGCEPGPIFRDFRDFRDFTPHKGERLSFVGGLKDSEVWEVSEDCAAPGTAMGRLKTAQPDARRIILAAPACAAVPTPRVGVFARW
jgi:hypothetical protein